MSERKLAPDKSTRLHWLQDRTTQWILQQLNEQFRALPPSQVAKSWEDAHRLAGQQQVLEAIIKLCDV